MLVVLRIFIALVKPSHPFGRPTTQVEQANMKATQVEHAKVKLGPPLNWWVKGKQPHLLNLIIFRNGQKNDPSSESNPDLQRPILDTNSRRCVLRASHAPGLAKSCHTLPKLLGGLGFAFCLFSPGGVQEGGFGMKVAGRTSPTPKTCRC